MVLLNITHGKYGITAQRLVFALIFLITSHSIYTLFCLIIIIIYFAHIFNARQHEVVLPKIREGRESEEICSLQVEAEKTASGGIIALPSC